MKAHALPKRGKQPTAALRRRESFSPHLLQHSYEATTFPLGEQCAAIDAWLADHEPDVWRQIRLEDDELFRLRALGVSARRYQERLDTLQSLYAYAERLYYDTQPNELSLPALLPGESVAIYYTFDDGSGEKVSGLNE
ncbi:MAG: hypothetical protein EXR78_06585 [Deltaproteobacteria bacterium]|nr:hypothetical protein [Deltaproteobacteria bacterium]